MFNLRRQCLLICVVALVAMASAGHLPERKNRVVGGRKIPISDVPSLVQLRENSTGYYHCAGTLVNPTQVVSAAHCVAGLYAEELFVVAGATSIYDAGVRSAIANYIAHPDFNRACGFDYDIVVLNLATPLVGPNIKPMCLCKFKLNAGAFFTIAGWGVTNKGYASDVINAARVPVIARDACSAMYAPAVISENMVCASVPGKVDSCPGDSGSAGIYRGNLCTIVSWGWGCARPEYPGVYTDINACMPFLRQQLKEWC